MQVESFLKLTMEIPEIQIKWDDSTWKWTDNIQHSQWTYCCYIIKLKLLVAISGCKINKQMNHFTIINIPLLSSLSSRASWWSGSCPWRWGWWGCGGAPAAAEVSSVARQLPRHSDCPVAVLQAVTWHIFTLGFLKLGKLYIFTECTVTGSS